MGFSIFLVSCASVSAGDVESILKKVPLLSWSLVKTLPHNSHSFTQGLVFDEEGNLIEGTGLYGKSRLIRFEGTSSAESLSKSLPKSLFGEGVTVMGDEIFQLTWKKGVCLVYDRKSLKPLRAFRYLHEGWGLTHDGERLIVSDGSSSLRFYDPKSFALLGQVEVTFKGEPVELLNELEWIDGRVFANVWQTNAIAVIDPVSGELSARLDCARLDRQQKSWRKDVLNGIAYNPTTDELWLTGKLWDQIYVVKLDDL